MLRLLFHSGDKAVTSGKRLPVLPDLEISNTFALSELADNIYQYHCCVDWSVSLNVIHPCWFAMRAIALQADLFKDDAQPFKALGLVHVANHIRMHRWVEPHETVTMTSRFGKVWSHKRGYMFSVLTTVMSGDECVLEIEAHNLARQSVIIEVGLAPYPKPEILSADNAIITNKPLALPSDLGKVYAKISGDYNPIHLHPLSAKLFGLKRHIAHGMWTKAKAFSVVAKQLWEKELTAHISPTLPNQLQIDVQFMQMIFLPAQIEFEFELDPSATHQAVLWVTSTQAPKPYLQMTVSW